MQCVCFICDTTCVLHPHYDEMARYNPGCEKRCRKTVLNAVLTFALLVDGRRLNKQITHKIQYISPSYPQLANRHKLVLTTPNRQNHSE